ncbi:DUF6119 family protein [Seleniivibrio woodruffii]|uniref:DUF6119 family protein n=1 Tax=Seleniivibrio woodruffii TaxID=1078050 RepID=UPI00240A9573|nr:DUF6119 family protein [Seleniivibrio woodruffii]
MGRNNNFSIYLLKEGYNSNNALKDNHSLNNMSANASKLPHEASLYMSNVELKSPWWKEFWGINHTLEQGLQGAIVFLPVENRHFAVTFGHSYHNLKDDSYDYNFGLITTLNCLDPNELKSTDILKPERGKRERIQIPVASDLNYFDFNKDESIIKKLTGIVKSEYKELFKNITGSSNLKVSSKIQADEILDFCKTLYEIYNKEDYLTSFPDLQNITPVKDPSVKHILNAKLVEAFNSDDVNLVLTIPDIIDPSIATLISYSGAGRIQKEYDDVFIAHYREHLRDNSTHIESVSDFKNHKMLLVDENNAIKNTFPIFKCFIFDSIIDNEYFHLCEGEWYQIKNDFKEQLKEELNSIFTNNTNFPECNEEYKDEGAYNEHTSNNSSNFICLDKTNIAPTGQTQIEPCDLYYAQNETAHLMHIKISTRSSSLSHLFNQGANSVELLRVEIESKRKLKELLEQKASEKSLNIQELYNPIDNDKFSIIYGIITLKSETLKSDALPFFSRISLRRHVRSFKLMGIKCSVILIKDNVDRKRIEMVE